MTHTTNHKGVNMARHLDLAFGPLLIAVGVTLLTIVGNALR